MPRPLPEIVRIDWPSGAPAPPVATDAALDRAAEVLRGGGLVAIPTETVYGLAADACDADAVEGIFRAKGRPATNPLIVHVADVAMARSLAAAWPEAAERIAAAFWPGPVTVVVPKGPRIPAIVTAGGPTVALRCPAHPLARRLIERAGIPLAAPSANRSERVSPTTAHHVLESLGDKVGLILDAGPCERGIESTVVDCTTTPPRILRPGPLSRQQLEAAVAGPVEWSHERAAGDSGPEPARSPGHGRRHYSPRTPLELARDPAGRVAELLAAGRRVGWLVLEADDRARALAGSRDLVAVPMPADPDAYARQLYATLHALDQRQLDRIVVDPPPADEAWGAVRDRLSRAAEG
ncbi:MAG: L-threonylcarbamoyladenylate synthase [Planctomycetota bacterium]